MNTVETKVNEIIAKAIATAKGVNVKLAWERDCKTKKDCTDIIRKRTNTVGRVGIDYNNRAIVQQLRESGDLPSEEQPIWHGKGQWVNFPYVLRHIVTNQKYLRLYQGTNENAKPSVQFFRNGQLVGKSELEDILLASEKRHDTSLCFCVKIEDMLDIGEYSPPPVVPVETPEKTKSIYVDATKNPSVKVNRKIPQVV